MLLAIILDLFIVSPSRPPTGILYTAKCLGVATIPSTDTNSTILSLNLIPIWARATVIYRLISDGC